MVSKEERLFPVLFKARTFSDYSSLVADVELQLCIAPMVNFFELFQRTMKLLLIHSSTATQPVQKK
jgi:hypothetical protein